jgi:hypothetical protein
MKMLYMSTIYIYNLAKYEIYPNLGMHCAKFGPNFVLY